MNKVECIFVIYSVKLGAGWCALRCEQGNDEHDAEKNIRASLSNDMLIYSSFLVSDRQSIEWDYFKQFIGDGNGILMEGLRFCRKSPEEVVWDINVQNGGRVIEQCYLKRYGVIVSCEKLGLEYSSAFDWYDVDIDSACRSVARFIPNGARLCGVYNGTSTGMCGDFMARHRGNRAMRIGNINFVNVKAVDAIKEFSWGILEYNHSGVDELEDRVFIDCEDVGF